MINSSPAFCLKIRGIALRLKILNSSEWESMKQKLLEMVQVTVPNCFYLDEI